MSSVTVMVTVFVTGPRPAWPRWWPCRRLPGCPGPGTQPGPGPGRGPAARALDAAATGETINSAQPRSWTCRSPAPSRATGQAPAVRCGCSGRPVPGGGRPGAREPSRVIGATGLHPGPAVARAAVTFTGRALRPQCVSDHARQAD